MSNKYRKKPVVVEAELFDPNDLNQHTRLGIELSTKDGTHSRSCINTLEGWLFVSEGDWIITGIKGEHYPCKPDIFEATYEPA